MQTVQLQCGNCSKLMAISVAHLGGQVQCPHCRAVVQTPAAPPAPTPAAPEVVERDSIFAPTDSGSDVLSRGAPRQLVEMPPPPAPAPAPPESTTTIEFTPEPEPRHDGLPLRAPAAAPLEEGDTETELPAPRPRPVYEKSMLPLIALIFLVPYAILTSVFCAYLLIQLRNQPHPLDMLPDPKPDKGPRKAERIRHDYPLAAHQKVGLGDALRVGDLEVMPQRVEMHKEGNLVLRLKVKNVSDDLVFAPISDAFLHVQTDFSGGKPYTFVQSENYTPLYGGFLEIKKADVNAGEGELAPGQEETILLTTTDKDRSTAKKVAASKDRLVWRVQLRRGLVPYRGKSLAATTVVGVAFNGRDIARLP